MNQKITAVEYRCNQCGRILVGYDRAIMKNEDYISIKGKLNLQLWDDELKRRYWVTVIPEDKPMLVVCDVTCLAGYMQFQKVQYMTIRDRKLRNEATFDQENGIVRPTHPYTPPYMKGKFDPKSH